MEFDSAIRGQIRNASFRSDGFFTEYLRACKDEAVITVAMLGESVIGWCCHLITDDADNCLMLYVKVAYRRQGIGSHMLSEMTSLFPRAIVYPSDEVSNLFFKSGVIQEDKISDEYMEEDDGGIY
jgi:ribosomal protein S18 acetylase RimI-like enzyme